MGEGVEENNPLIKKQFNAYWLKIFFHDATNGVFFGSAEDAKASNTEKRFSSLKNITPSFKKGDKYEFLLEYPIEHPKKYARWKQTLNPLDDTETKTHKEATGFKKVHSDWNDFKGLVRTSIPNNSNCVSCLLDGNPGDSSFFFAIGMYSKCDSFWSSKVPGPDGPISQVYLWICIPFKFTSKKSYIFTKISTFMYHIIILK